MRPEHAERFLAAYRDAFNRFDADAVTAHYVLPCVYSQGAGTIVVTRSEELRENNARLLARYRDAGVVRAEFGAPGLLSMGNDHAALDVPWTLWCTPPRAALRFRTGYGLRLRDGVWRIWAVAAYSEPDAGAAVSR